MFNFFFPSVFGCFETSRTEQKIRLFSFFFFSFLLLHCWLVSHQQMSVPMAATGTSPTRPFDLGSRKVAIRFLPRKTSKPVFS